MSFVGATEAKKVVSVEESWKPRYPLRVVLCAYMILGHPDTVFSGMGECEIALVRSAQDYVEMFELLIKIILDGLMQCSDQESGSAVIKRCTFRSQLAAFDKAWCVYLNCFVIWKVMDAQSQEEDLVRATCQLEASMIQTCNLTPGDTGQLSDDMKAIQHQGKIKQTMEKAFWDVIMESVKQDQPNYDLIVELMGEDRDEFCDMSPQSWKEDIFATIGLEILSQVLISSNLDVDYLRKILGFSLITLQKLSAPANEEIMKDTHQELFSALSEMCQSWDESNNSCVKASVKGLQFVLEQIQNKFFWEILKKEISKARVRLMEPLVRGPAGVDYLRNAFSN